MTYIIPIIIITVIMRIYVLSMSIIHIKLHASIYINIAIYIILYGIISHILYITYHI